MLKEADFRTKMICKKNKKESNNGKLCKLYQTLTVGSKIIRALAIILAIFSHLIANFYHLILVMSSTKPKDNDLT